MEAAPGLEDRLLTDDARPADLFDAGLAIGDDPVAADQLHRLVAEVLELDAVGEEPQPVLGPRALRDVAGADADSHVAGDGLGTLGHETASSRSGR